MGGNIKNKMGAQKINEAQTAAKEAEEKQKEKKSLIIRVVIAAVVLAAAVVACVLMVNHDFNSDRDVLHGTYYAERRFFYETESGTDISDVQRSFIVTFYEDGRMSFKYDVGARVYYYEYKEDAQEPYDGVILRYAEGEFEDEVNVVMDENGDVSMYYITDSMNFTVPMLVQCFGESDTLSMLKGIYNEDICALLVAGNYDSITDEQLTAMNLKREQLADVSFAIKNLSTVTSLYKISDDELSRDAALGIWNAQHKVSPTDAVSETDK